MKKYQTEFKNVKLLKVILPFYLQAVVTQWTAAVARRTILWPATDIIRCLWSNYDHKELVNLW